MARKNDLAKTKFPCIYSLKTNSGQTEFYATFSLEGKTYQKINLTKRFPAQKINSAKKASNQLEYIKAQLRDGKNPLVQSKNNIRNIVVKIIDEKKPKNDKKDNSHYKKTLRNFYNLYVDPIIGHLKPESVKHHHVDKILAGIKHHSASYQKNLHVLMFKEFENRFRKGELRYNPFYDLDYGTDKGKESLENRLNEPIQEAVRKLYRTTLESAPSHRLMFVLSLMLARRVGEIYKLKYSHVKQFSTKEWYVLATEDITKTGVNEKYPLPKEAIELLPENILDPEEANRPLFSFCYSGIFTKEHKLVKEAGLDINKGYKITSHDNRNFFISVLAELQVETDLADRCLSHQNKKSTKNTYLDVSYELRKQIFTTYWKHLRLQLN